YVETTFNDFGTMQKKLDDMKIEIMGAELLRLPHDKIKLNADNENLVNNLIEKLEEDDDVVNIFHNMDESEN
ncbi:MAG TPA: YebC/PmpR family DNA-binding transcriptional regulator, partial [Chitinophagales bacterium]|nr:YebC/PmpR family DNA-binding transcriptional regulator [Chitinophagales bacterium]